MTHTCLAVVAALSLAWSSGDPSGLVLRSRGPASETTDTTDDGETVDGALEGQLDVALERARAQRTSAPARRNDRTSSGVL